jgi:hypothetical protein
MCLEKFDPPQKPAGMMAASCRHVRWLRAPDTEVRYPRNRVAVHWRHREYTASAGPTWYQIQFSLAVANSLGVAPGDCQLYGVSHEKKTTPTPSDAESTASTDGRRSQQ